MPECDFNKVAEITYGTGVLLQICCPFLEHLFLKNSPG